MSDEVKRVKKFIEIDVVEMKIQISEKFYNNMVKAKKEVADKRGYDISNGEYIEEVIDELMAMVDSYGKQLQDAAAIIKEQDDALGNPTLEEYQDMKNGEKPKDPESGEDEIEAPEELYAHIIKDEDKRTMYQ